MMENGILVKGSLEHYSLPQILTSLSKEQKTGTCTLEKNNTKKNIYLKDGNIIFAASNDNNDRFGSMMLRAGKITVECLNKSIELLEETHKRIGTILVELGCMTPADLFIELKNQVREIVLSTFEWEDGIFRFEEAIPSAEMTTLKTPVEEFIRDVTQRIASKRKNEYAIFIKKVDELCKNIDWLSYYYILGVQMNATIYEIKKAYLQMVKYYHPDRYHFLLDNTLKDKVTTVFTFLNKAYDTLSNEAKRAEYDKIQFGMARGKPIDNDLIRAREQFRRGLEEFKKDNFRGAADIFSWTVRLKPEKATYWAHLSLALSKIPRKKKEAEEAMLKAIELEPYNANYYVHLGIIYLNSGLRQKAIRQFKTALTLDPTNTRAHRELEKLKVKK